MTITKQYEENLTISFVVRGPGRLRATVNGRVASFSCHDDPDQIVHCPASDELGNSIEVWDYGPPAQTYISGGWSEGEAKPGDLLTIRIYPSQFTGDDWRVNLFLWTPEGGATGLERP